MFPTLLLDLKQLKVIHYLLFVGILLPITSCTFSKAELTESASAQQSQTEVPTVNVAIAQTGTVQEEREYTGTTQPLREVALRSQVQAQLLDLTVDVGDRVNQGQTLAQLDSTTQAATVAEAAAEVTALQAEVADVQAQVSDARTQVNRAQAELQQARADLNRNQFLAQQGAIATQQAEQARTAVKTAEATLRSTQQQVRSRQQQVTAAQQRVEAQRAVVAQQQQQQSFTELASPVTGFVLGRSLEPGSLVQPGNEVLRLGDFSQVKVAVQVSELELGTIQPNQTVQVRLDAFPDQTFNGRVDRISPAADPVARLVPIEVTIANPNGRIGSGLLARVAFNQRSNRSRILISETALLINQTRPNASSDRNLNLPRDIGTVFIVAGTGNEAKVTARPVTLGRRQDGQVEILSGLQVGDRYITRSSKALKTGDAVRLSILSE